MDKFTDKLLIDNVDNLSKLLGTFDENISIIMRETDTIIYVRDDVIYFSGDENAVNIAKM